MEKTIAFYFGPLSEPLERDEAIERHVDYLLNGPHVKTFTNKIVHSLYLRQNELETLYEAAIQGLRLYFCKEVTSSSALNIILVPVDAFGENILEDDKIVNTLQPCPDKCPPLINMATSVHTPQLTSFSEEDLNRILIHGSFYWYKPNNPSASGKVWYDENHNPVDDPR